MSLFMKVLSAATVICILTSVIFKCLFLTFDILKH